MINEIGQFNHLDVFGDWIFDYHELTPELMEFLCTKLVTVRMRGTDPPNTLLRHHKKWFTLINLANIVTNYRLAAYVTSDEDLFIKVIYQDLPDNYKKVLTPIFANNGRVRPHTWDDLQDAVHMAWKLIKKDKDNYHPSKLKFNKT